MSESEANKLLYEALQQMEAERQAEEDFGRLPAKSELQIKIENHLQLFNC